MLDAGPTSRSPPAWRNINCHSRDLHWQNWYFRLYPKLYPSIYTAIMLKMLILSEAVPRRLVLALVLSFPPDTLPWCKKNPCIHIADWLVCHPWGPGGSNCEPIIEWITYCIVKLVLLYIVHCKMIWLQSEIDYKAGVLRYIKTFVFDMCDIKWKIHIKQKVFKKLCLL